MPPAEEGGAVEGAAGHVAGPRPYILRSAQAARKAAPRLQPGALEGTALPAVRNWEGLTIPACGQVEQEEEKGGHFAPSQLFMPCFWRWVLQ